MCQWLGGRLDELRKLVDAVQSFARSLSEAEAVPTPKEGS